MLLRGPRASEAHRSAISRMASISALAPASTWAHSRASARLARSGTGSPALELPIASGQLCLGTQGDQDTYIFFERGDVAGRPIAPKPHNGVHAHSLARAF